MHADDRKARAATIRRRERNTTADGSPGPRNATTAAGVTMGLGLMIAGCPSETSIAAALSGIGAITLSLTAGLWLLTTPLTNSRRPWPRWRRQTRGAARTAATWPA